jgi:hypothetical protein
MAKMTKCDNHGGTEITEKTSILKVFLRDLRASVVNSKLDCC